MEEQPIEHHHRDLRGGGARASVFGVSDGLVTNISLILGVAGAHPGSSFVRLAGIAGLIAGSVSMASGEYISMKAQRELLQRELNIEREAIDEKPSQEADELQEIYEKRGIDTDIARSMVDEVMGDPELALETHAREELGIDPNSLGSPIQASLASFGSFALGALLPLIPWLFMTGTVATVASISIAAIAALGVGTVLAVFTGRPRWHSAIRQLAVTVVAASVTYGIGRLVGVSST